MGTCSGVCLLCSNNKHRDCDRDMLCLQSGGCFKQKCGCIKQCSEEYFERQTRYSSFKKSIIVTDIDYTFVKRSYRSNVSFESVEELLLYINATIPETENIRIYNYKVSNTPYLVTIKDLSDGYKDPNHKDHNAIIIYLAKAIQG